MGTKHNSSSTPAYMALEYIYHGKVTPNIDIYGFGIVFLEILSGEHPIMMKGTKFFLDETIGPLLEFNNPIEELNGWMDPSLHEVYAIDQAMALDKLAKSRVEENPLIKPTIDHVLKIRLKNRSVRILLNLASDRRAHHSIPTVLTTLKSELVCRS